jgi:hypothetical protein
MKLKTYNVIIGSKSTHKAIDEVSIVADGYMVALVEANKYTKMHYSNAYVKSVREKGL